LALVLDRLRIPVFPIIRSRGGGFVYDENDVAVMRTDLAHARALGAPGAVIGALTASGEIDRGTIAQLREDAGPMALTFHRAFDHCADLLESLEVLIELGIDRVLTSGAEQSAWEGRELLALLVRRAAGRIGVMAGGGVNEDHAAELVRETGVAELHVRAAALHHDSGRASHITLRKAPSRDELARGITSAERLRAIRQAIS
jgi:copper homeostasis protein